MSEEPISPLNSLIQTADVLESEGNLEGAIKLLSDFLSNPANTNDLSQPDLIKASTKLSRLKEYRDRASALRTEAISAEKGADFSLAEASWLELLTILPHDDEAKGRLEILPEKRKHAESIRLKLTFEDALEKGHGILAAQCLDQYRKLNPSDLWAIEILPTVEAAKQREERSRLEDKIKDALSRNKFRLVLELGEDLRRRNWLEGHQLEIYRHAQSKIVELETLKQRGKELYHLGDLKSSLRCFDEAQNIDAEDPTVTEPASRIRKIISLRDSLKIALSDRNQGRIEKIVHELTLLNYPQDEIEEVLRDFKKQRSRKLKIGAFAALALTVIGAGVYLSNRGDRPGGSFTQRVVHSIKNVVPSMPSFSSPTKPVRGNLSGRWHEGVIATIQTGQTEPRRPGDDASYRMGRPRSFIDNGDGTISDLNAGLMWVKHPADAGLAKKYQWKEAKELCERLDYGGYTDWMLPTASHIATIINHGNRFPIENLFEINQGEYWTSSDFRGDYEATFLNTGAAMLMRRKKDWHHFVCPVRYLTTPLVVSPEERFESLNEGRLIYDRLTDLTWIRNPGNAGIAGSWKWEDAVRACEELSVEGYDDWRMPNRNELLSVFSFTRKGNALAPGFEIIKEKNYYTSSHHPTQRDRPFFVRTYDGYSFRPDNPSERFFLLPVRGGVGGSQKVSEGQLQPKQQPTAAVSTPKPSPTMFVDDTVDLKWITKAPMPTPRMALRGSAIDGKIYAVGGRSEQENQSPKNEMYDPKTDTWTSRAPMQSPRARFELAACGGKLFAMGGIGENEVTLNSVEVYDPSKDVWTTAPPIKNRRRFFASCVIGENIYIMGGDDDSVPLGTCEVFNSRTETWTSIADMPKPKSDLVTVVWNGQIYAIGGFPPREVGEVFRYDPQSNRWTVLTPNMPTPRIRFAGGLLGDKIFTVGGSLTGVVEMFSAVNHTWMTGPPLPTARENHCVVSTDGVLYAIGGRHQSEGLLGTNEALVDASNDGRVNPQSVEKNDWSSFLGPNQNLTSTETGWNQDWNSTPPKELWRRSVGTGFSAVTVSNGRAFTAGNAKETDTIWCFSSDTGQVIWSHSIPVPIHANQYEGGPGSTPNVDGDLLFYLSKIGDLVCLDSVSGAVRWQKDLKKEFGVEPPKWFFAGSPVVDGDSLYLDAGKVICLDKRTGRSIWETKDFGSSYSTPIRIDQGGYSWLAAVPASGLVLIDSSSGREVSVTPWRTKWDMHAPSPVWIDGQIFLSSGYHTGSALFDVSLSGKLTQLWKKEDIWNHIPTSIHWNGDLYGLTGWGDKSDCHLYCLNVKSGAILWSNPEIKKSTMILVDGKLLVLTEKGEMILAKASPYRYEEISRFHALGGKCWTTPTLSNGRLYLRNAKGDLVCYDLRNR